MPLASISGTVSSITTTHAPKAHEVMKAETKELGMEYYMKLYITWACHENSLFHAAL